MVIDLVGDAELEPVHGVSGDPAVESASASFYRRALAKFDRSLKEEGERFLNQLSRDRNRPGVDGAPAPAPSSPVVKVGGCESSPSLVVLSVG